MMEEIRLTQFSKGGGCGCKIAPAVLEQILQHEGGPSFSSLLVGNESSDDAAVYQLSNDSAIVSTTDFFLPIVDDAFDFGRIAAANAISDVYAMGAKPLMAIAILGWPIDKLPAALASEVLRGARAICSEAGIPLAGGHTIDSNDPIFGLSVTGTVAPANLKRNNTAKVDDLLYLTKPLGVGIMSTAQKRGLLLSEHYPQLLKQMTTLNSIGEKLGPLAYVHAMTDVTGFGLLGHLFEMVNGSDVYAELQYSSLKKTDGLADYLRQRIVPDATSRNWSSYHQNVKFEKGVDVMEAFNLLPDPQTNGGLLIAVDQNDAGAFEAILSENGLADFAVPIGKIVASGEKRITVKP
jgi:selenide,water dikinase